MAYTTVKKVTEFAGDMKTVIYNVTPDAATGTVVVTDIDTIQGVSVAFTGDATANCYSISTSRTGTTITIKLWKAGGTAADTAYVPFDLVVFGRVAAA